MPINWNQKAHQKCNIAQRPLYPFQDVMQYRGWATGTPSSGERNVQKFIDHRIRPGQNCRVLHMGTGRNDLAMAISGLPRVARFDGCTIFPLEQTYGLSLGIPCCAIYALDKYDPRAYLTMHGPYDLIVDVNIASFACCYHHLTWMMNIWINRLLTPGGMIVTHALGMKYKHSNSPVDPLTVDDLNALTVTYPVTITEPCGGLFVIQKDGGETPLTLEK